VPEAAKRAIVFPAEKLPISVDRTEYLDKWKELATL
jgi:hypothetical protein